MILVEVEACQKYQTLAVRLNITQTVRFVKGYYKNIDVIISIFSFSVII
jgi:hypothetical protein